MRGLKGKVAFVTGAASGIGKAIVTRLAAEGAKVAVADINEAAAKAVAKEIGSAAVAIKVDVTNRAAAQAAVAEAERALGPIDILVNNAGWDKIEPFVQSTEETWDKVIALNFKAHVNCARAVLDGMIARKSGKIVSVSSDAGRVGSSGEAVYGGAKAGVIGFAKTLAREVARYGINVNVICPGPTNTPLFQQGQSDPRLAKLSEALKHAIPFGRIGEPEDVASAVVFFASDDASFITGQTLSVSGGLTMES